MGSIITSSASILSTSGKILHSVQTGSKIVEETVILTGAPAKAIKFIRNNPIAAGVAVGAVATCAVAVAVVKRAKKKKSQEESK